MIYNYSINEDDSNLLESMLYTCESFAIILNKIGQQNKWYNDIEQQLEQNQREYEMYKNIIVKKHLPSEAKNSHYTYFFDFLNNELIIEVHE